MRTAVVRVDVDPSGQLEPGQLTAGMTTLRGLAEQAGAGLIDVDLAMMPVGRRQVRLLIAGTDPENLKQEAIQLCTKAFGTAPMAGIITYVSRGTDDDARGVLAGFGLTGDIRRSPGDDELDVVYVTLSETDLQRVPESRIHTALEASLNCEVRIVVVN